MDSKLKDLEPLESRKVNHIVQLSDNQYLEGTYYLLKGKPNTFFFAIHNGVGSISRPFEEELKEPLEDLVSFASDYCAVLHLTGFPSTILDETDFTLLAQGGLNKSLDLYQIPLSIEQYELKLQKKKFCKSGFKYRPLEQSDRKSVV